MAHHQVQRNVPLTPPSASEASEREQNLKSSAKKYPSDEYGDDDYCVDDDHDNSNDDDIICSPRMLRMDYWHTLKAVFTNRAFVVSECSL